MKEKEPEQPKEKPEGRPQVPERPVDEQIEPDENVKTSKMTLGRINPKDFR
jgi:hypothetical protein